MPGVNCSIFGCSMSRKSKNIAIFRVPTGNDEYSVQWREKIIIKDKVVDQNFADFKTRINKLKLTTGWEIKNKENSISVLKMDEIHLYIVPIFEIIVVETLKYNILVYNWLLPESNDLMSNYQMSFKNVTLNALISDLLAAKICVVVNFKTDSIISHSVPKMFLPELAAPITKSEFNRPKNCLVLCSSEKCKVCKLKRDSI